MDNFWKSIEVECWSRGFNYLGYLAFRKLVPNEGAVLDKQAYTALCKLLDAMQLRNN